MRRSAVALLGVFAYNVVAVCICATVGRWSMVAFWPVFLLLAGVGVWLVVRFTRMVLS
jgi:hypothetical protein